MTRPRGPAHDIVIDLKPINNLFSSLLFPLSPTQINEEHHLTEKASKAVISGMNALTRAIKEGAKGLEKKEGHEEGNGDGHREYDFAEQAKKK